MKGKSGAYLQYTCVRANSILKKVGEPSVPLKEIPKESFNDLEPAALSLVKILALLPEVIDQCCASKTPHTLAHHLYEVGKEINHFYQQVRIKDLESPLKDLYLHLLKSSVQVLTNGLALLNIEIPERM